MHRSRVVKIIVCGVISSAFSLGFQTGRAKSSSGATKTRTFRFTYSVTVRDIPESAQKLSIWVPIPKTGPHQMVRDLEVIAPMAYSITQEKQYGNLMIYLSGTAPLPSELKLQFQTLIERQAFNVISEKQKNPGGNEPAAHDLELHELVPIDGIIAELARDATEGSSTPLEKARAIYDYVTETMSYDQDGEGWGRGDALYACDARTGNCTDFHSLVIGMARACGIPARFVMGFPLPGDKVAGEILGYHCWAEMYIDDIGWLPVDSSEASRHPEKHEAFFGGLDANRVQFTLGRDLKLQPAATELLNYFVYPHVEVDDVDHSGVRCSFSFADVDE